MSKSMLGIDVTRKLCELPQNSLIATFAAKASCWVLRWISQI